MNDDYDGRTTTTLDERDNTGRSRLLQHCAFDYSHLMVIDAFPKRARGLALLMSWSRVRFTVAVSLFFGFLLGLSLGTSVLGMMVRTTLAGLVVMLAFGLFEQWPRRLPKWLARSALQVVAVALVMPFAVGFAYALTTRQNQDTEKEKKVEKGFVVMSVTGLLFAPWIAVGALLKQRDAFAREQALEFELERSKLERHASEARLRLLQAQVEPHFLFNTLANVQALVDAGSPHASRVLASLIAYLRAAVPRIHDRTTTLGQELQLVRAYLEVMQMRMPDRLQFALRVDPTAETVACPPMTLLTLVENALRHGIDPSEDGGRIYIDVLLRDHRCIVRVSDTGVGLKLSGDGLGTGLATLRERLQLEFGTDARLQLFEVQPHGVCAELDLPVRTVST